MKQLMVFLTLSALLLAPGLARANIFELKGPVHGVAVAAQASPQEALAARELRRYAYLRSGALLPIVRLGAQDAGNLDTRSIVVAGKDSPLLGALIADARLKKEIGSLAPQEYLLKSIRIHFKPVLLVIGGDASGTLYGAYRLAEHWGVRFYLHGDVVPDKQAALDFPALDERAKPLFALRGIQPFHDFPEGPDWWSGDDYKAIIAQLAKLRMNFFGLHTYPEMRPHAEPTVWIGLPGEFDKDGRVSQSYATAYFNTRRADWSGNWGYTSMKTGDFLYGSSLLFDQDDYGADVQRGMMPAPKTPEACNELFNRTSAMLRGAFEEARALGVKTCVGTETPLTIPGTVCDRLNQRPDYVGPLGGRIAQYRDRVIAGTGDSLLYNTARYDLKGYALAVPNGSYRVTLKFCEISHENPNGRVFDVTLQGVKVLDKLDIFVRAGGKDKAIDYTYHNIKVSDGRLRIGCIPHQEYPLISAIEIASEGGTPFSLKINCGGPATKDYLADDGNQLMAAEDIKTVYKAMFQRIMAAYPIDYYWFWTNEGWTWQGADASEVQSAARDLGLAVSAAKEVGAPFGLATCGWVLGPAGDRAKFDRDLPKEVALSCINRQVGRAPVDTTFAQIKGRPLWAIPWMEDDPTLTSVELWAGRMRRDAADALAYGCTGLFGIHWRTRVLGPNVAALAQAGWDQKPFSLYPEAAYEGPLGGRAVAMPGQRIGNTAEPALYRTARVGMSGYRFKVPNGVYNVTLKFCELASDGPGGRVFSVRAQGQLAIDNLDVYALAGPSSPYDYEIENVLVNDGWLNLEFLAQTNHEAMICAIDIESKGYARKINCGGPACGAYAADLAPLPRALPTADFYQDWALNQFGPEIAAPAAAIFTRIDSALPLTTTWTDGPGGLIPEARPWEQVAKEYRFVDELGALSGKVRGAGNRERYEYWLNNFRYMETAHRLRCVWTDYNHAMERVKAAPGAEERKKLARELALPLRKEMIGLTDEVFARLIATVSSNGELGTVANWNSHIVPTLVTKPGEELAAALGGPLPAEAQPKTCYCCGPNKVIVPTVRGCLDSGEPLDLKVIVLARETPSEADLFWRPLGQGAFSAVGLKHVARGVYQAQIPAAAIGGRDIEYYVQATIGQDKPLTFPATAPTLNQTVVQR